MKATYLTFAGGLLLTCGLAVFAATRGEPSKTEVAPSEPSSVSSDTGNRPDYESYLDAPQTVGDWRYDGPFASSNFFAGGDDPVAPRFEATQASFGNDPDRRSFMIVCDLTNRAVRLIRPGTFERSPTMRIVTETRDESFHTLSHSGRYAAVELPVDAPLLDAMAITKGRVAVEMEGHQPLHMPAWPEISRVVEDCR